MSASPLDHPAVRRVKDVLEAAGSKARIIALDETARSAADAAASIGTPLGSIVKSLVFAIAGRPVMALVSGDRQCDTKALPAALGLEGKVKRADADAVRAATGFSIGGVAPVGHVEKLPMAIDADLARFPTIYAAAGHPYCVFATTVEELAALTGAAVVQGIGVPPKQE